MAWTAGIRRLLSARGPGRIVANSEDTSPAVRPTHGARLVRWSGAAALRTRDQAGRRHSDVCPSPALS
jgi:hypothetical protein